MVRRPHVWATILAGGFGSRFWPLSTRERPKQLLPLAGPDPMIVDTLRRLEGLVPPQRVRVLAQENMVASLMAATGLRRESFIVEPWAGGTAAALARSAWEIAQEDPDAVQVSLHSDAIVRPAAAFRDLLAVAASTADRERLLLTVGATPDRPETGYGYIAPGTPVEAPKGYRMYRVESFVEKPGPETAARYVADGYRWNTGIFLWPVQTFLDEVAATAPDIGRAFERLGRGDVPGFFRQAGTASIDVAVFERSDRVASIDATFEWDDVGSWEALARLEAQDARGNVSHGQVDTLDAARNIVYADSGRIVLFGVKDLLVVRTAETTLVMPRASTSDIKHYLNQIDTSPSYD